MASPIDHAWNMLKASTRHEIREVMPYSDESEKNPSKVTANPIIERLMRERDEAEHGATVPRAVTRLHSTSTEPAGYSLHGPTGVLSSFTNRGPMSIDESRAANAAQGVELGDQWRGDYVVGSDRPSR